MILLQTSQVSHTILQYQVIIYQGLSRSWLWLTAETKTSSSYISTPPTQKLKRGFLPVRVQTLSPDAEEIIEQILQYEWNNETFLKIINFWVAAKETDRNVI